MSFYGHADLPLTVVRELLPGWRDGISAAGSEKHSSAFEGIMGGLFTSSSYDEELSADENWEAFESVMAVKMRVLFGLGFSFDAAIRSHLCTAQERAFSAFHLIDDLIGKRSFVGYVDDHIQSWNARLSTSERDNLTRGIDAAYAMAIHFDLEPEAQVFLQECALALVQAINFPRDDVRDRRLREFQLSYLGDRSYYRSAMWQCIKDIAPGWNHGDEVAAITLAERSYQAAALVEPVLRNAWDNLHQPVGADEETYAWAQFLKGLQAHLQYGGRNRKDLREIDEFLDAADPDHVQDQRIACALRQIGYSARSRTSTNSATFAR